MFKLNDIAGKFNLNQSNRANYTGANFEIGHMILSKQDWHMLITSESKRIRVWDLRAPLLSKDKAAIEVESPQIKTRMCEINTEKTTKAYKMHYKPEINKLVAHF